MARRTAVQAPARAGTTGAPAPEVGFRTGTRTPTGAERNHRSGVTWRRKPKGPQTTKTTPA
eukprot:1293728-Alexandrium_andersonii.AAC.1